MVQHDLGRDDVILPLVTTVFLFPLAGTRHKVRLGYASQRHGFVASGEKVGRVIGDGKGTGGGRGPDGRR